jgi:Mannosyltransferase putative
MTTMANEAPSKHQNCTVYTGCTIMNREVELLDSSTRATVLKLVHSRYQRMLDELRESDAIAPDWFSGRGIVICAGGPRFFTCAWVLIHMLRHVVKSALPIQVWYRGADEMDGTMLALLQTLDCVELVDATKVPGYERIHGNHKWALKPFAILNSRFREVLFIDADNVPVLDPAFLFETPQYLETGAIFWPDLNPVPQSSPIWEITRVDYRDEPSFESGQIVLDKARCWKPLLLTMHLNEQAEFYYRIVHGDKDTFHFGWHMADQTFAMPTERPGCLTPLRDPLRFGIGPVLLQSGFDGTLIFQHRNWPKWIAFGDNLRVPGFLYEGECLEFIGQLEERWNGRLSGLNPRPPDGYRKDGGRWFRYVQIGNGERMMEFLPDQRIGRGGADQEQRWVIAHECGKPAIEILGERHVTCRLVKQDDGVWRGRWLYNERYLVELIPWADAIS